MILGDPNMYGNQIETGSDINEEGVIQDGDLLSLELDDDELLPMIGSRIDRAESWWDKEIKLSKVRKDNEQRWLNNNLSVSGNDQLHKFQVPYKDNRIFLSVETLVSNLVSQLPEPIVVPGSDSDMARELAYGFEKVLLEKSGIAGVKGALEMMLRHILIGYRIGATKSQWDFNAGRLMEDGTMSGDTKVRAVRPHKIVIEDELDDINDASFIAENLKSTVEQLAYKFPDKKDEIWKAAGIEKTDKVSFGKKVGYWEVWFDYLDNKGVKQEALAWRLNSNVLLGRGKNPNFNYEDPTDNYFMAPKKPYTFINQLRTGKYAYDDTSLTEQAATLQDVLEKRGRQIVENADQANSTKVFNANMIKAKDVQKYVDNPRQNIIVKGDVRMAFKREAPKLLPSYVLQDKFDARSEIDNIFGTNAPIRGEVTDSQTLGQEVLSQRSNLGRLKPLADRVEESAGDIYRQQTQLYKVYSSGAEMVSVMGDNGEQLFIEFDADKIDNGFSIKIQEGSSMPNDKMQDKADVMELAKLGGKIDPLTMAEKMHVKNPRKMATRLIDFIWRPDKYIQNHLGEGDEQAELDEVRQTIQRINQGESVPPKENASKNYIAGYNQFISSQEFKELDPEIQRLHIEHIKGTIALVKGEDGPEEQVQPQQEGGGIISKLGALLGRARGE